ncbi:unnamed protein product (macronuclear) [Paramecium tetraurelia]|uniref:Uncharacterized protein n=1 Tax=Paramecium tetraurelia TaxID=5888 RepID=A0E9K8_PARTE|nr:uncharacterized protein GSPATT00024706001 [Paramecium tetraurelia]CAK91975.1 unnamed protein product [Paramecium tetraurelia]|eukprot:XP_001459372.1 hypothetical protein (macronuclear) [Paramecium tetraurelia strain d4-2]
MKYFFLIWFVYLTLGNSIVGKKASEQFFPLIMDWLKKQEQKIDQALAFSAITEIIQQTDEELLQINENSEFVNSFQQQVFCQSNIIKILKYCKVKQDFEHDRIGNIDKFIQDELKHNSNYFKIMIKDKEKMIDQDNKELEKVKKSIKDHTKMKDKLNDILELIQEIDISLQIGTAEKLYKILEIIESKAVIGLFKQQSEEIQLYLTHVDQLFKTKNFQQDQFEIINLISMIKNILLDMKFNIQLKMQEDDMATLETIRFFENTKITHQIALDYFKGESNQFLGIIGNLMKIWEQSFDNQNEIYKDNIQFCQIIEKLSQEMNKVDSLNSTPQFTKYSLKKTEVQFLKQQN